MSRAPRYNIQTKLSDVRPELVSFDAGELKDKSLLRLSLRYEQSRANLPISSPDLFKNWSRSHRLGSQTKHSGQLPHWLKSITFLSALAFMVSISAYSLLAWQFKKNATVSANLIYNEFKASATSLSSFDLNTAHSHLLSANRQIKNLNREAHLLGFASIIDTLSHFLPHFEKLSNSFANLEQVSDSALSVSDKLLELKSSGFSYFLNGEGDKLLILLKGMRSDVRSITANSDALINALNEFNPADSNLSNFEFKNDLYDLENFLNNLIAFLDYPHSRHWLILFQNPSEIRPAGGFIGSFADLTIKRGQLELFSVVDIYDPDGWISQKVVPPKPLQTITTDWEARDSNWFFDFKDSASTVVNFLNSSHIYSEKNISFSGVTAINTDVLASLLEIAGPIEMPAVYNLTISKDNFLAAIQDEIENKRSRDQSQPKTVLKDLVPLILNELSNLNEIQKETLLTLFLNHLNNKDIMFYTSEPDLQTYFERYQIAGRVFNINSSFSGDYLAVVNANIAGGKTDAFITQDIYLNSRLLNSGLIDNYLSITRAHAGGNEPYEFYNKDNQNYLRILVPEGSLLKSIAGDTKKVIWPSIDYETSGYSTHSKITELERDQREAGKTVFSAWLTTPPNSTKTIKFHYQNNNRILFFNGQRYKFVFDKQSGVNGGLVVSVSAPPGFVWQESDSHLYIFRASSPKKRETFTVTLKKL